MKLADLVGRNLDAFNDVLEVGVVKLEPFDKIFVWKGHQKAKLALGESYFTEIIEIFHEANVGMRVQWVFSTQSLEKEKIIYDWSDNQ